MLSAENISSPAPPDAPSGRNSRDFWLRPVREFFAAVQFLTRLPVPRFAFTPDLIFTSAKFYPVVGVVVAIGAIIVERLLRGHLPASVAALVVLAYLVIVTGGFHEDGLADAIDGLGGGWTRERKLEIMRDSRIGSYGSLALVLSLVARWQLLALLPRAHFAAYLLAAHALCRWTTLPLAMALPSARKDGLGVQLASRFTAASLIIATIIACGVAGAVLRLHAIAPVVAVSAVTFLTALFYRAKLGGVTGDCFGATNQLAEIAVYLCGVWM
jgi:adenosylcobinamide-GDP ribazoletransferase